MYKNKINIMEEKSLPDAHPPFSSRGYVTSWSRIFKILEPIWFLGPSTDPKKLIHTQVPLIFLASSDYLQIFSPALGNTNCEY
jgi:hypothetical protein